LSVGTWPLDFFPKNKVRWLADRNGLHFNDDETRSINSAGGVVFSPYPFLTPQTELSKKNSLSIELWIRPTIEPRGCRTRILSFCDESKNEALFIGQWKNYLLVRWPAPSSGGRTYYRKIGVGQSLIAGKIRFVTITSSDKGTAIYLEGKRVKNFPDVRLIAKNENLLNKIILLGNSPDAKSPWSGDLFGLALHGHLLTDKQVYQSFEWWTKNDQLPPIFHKGMMARYNFDERFGIWANSSGGLDNPLLIPLRLQFKKRILSLPDISDLVKIYFIKDAILNVIGFILFGFFLCLWSSRFSQTDMRGNCLIAIFIGISVSLCIELLQIYLPTRDSSITDLICNTVGTVIGVMLSQRGTYLTGIETIKKSI